MTHAQLFRFVFVKPPDWITYRGGTQVALCIHLVCVLLVVVPFILHRKREASPLRITLDEAASIGPKTGGFEQLLAVGFGAYCEMKVFFLPPREARVTPS